MSYTSPKEDAILSGTTADASDNDRIAAVWAKAHELFAAKVGESEIGQYLTDAKGYVLLLALETAADKSVAGLLAIVQEHLDAVPAKK